MDMKNQILQKEQVYLEIEEKMMLKKKIRI
jgi:hypothetical protein